MVLGWTDLIMVSGYLTFKIRAEEFVIRWKKRKMLKLATKCPQVLVNNNHPYKGEEHCYFNRLMKAVILGVSEMVSSRIHSPHSLPVAAIQLQSTQ